MIFNKEKWLIPILLIVALTIVSLIPSFATADVPDEQPTSSTILVAAYDSLPSSKANARFVCSGNDDDIEINKAFELVKDIGGHIQMSEGTFLVDAPVRPTTVCGLRWTGRAIGYMHGAYPGGTTIRAARRMKSVVLFNTPAHKFFIEMSDMEIDGNYKALFPLHLKGNVTDLIFEDLFVRAGRSVNIYLDPQEHSLYNIYFNRVWSESSLRSGFYASGRTGWIENLTLENFFAAVNREHGMSFAGPNLRGITVINPKSRHNGRDGMHFAGVRDITVLGGSIQSNSGVCNNKYDGIHIGEVGNSVQSMDMAIIGTSIFDYDIPPGQRYGVHVDDASDRIIIAHCLIRNNVSAPIKVSEEANVEVK